MSLDITGWACRSLLSCAGLHARGGGPLADAIEGRHPDFILGVGVQAANAVAGGGDAVHRLVLAVRPFCSVLNDIIRYRVWVAGVPGDGHTGGSGLGNYGCAGRLWQGWGLDRGGGKKRTIYVIHDILWLCTEHVVRFFYICDINTSFFEFACAYIYLYQQEEMPMLTQ